MTRAGLRSDRRSRRVLRTRLAVESGSGKVGDTGGCRHPRSGETTGPRRPGLRGTCPGLGAYCCPLTRVGASGTIAIVAKVAEGFEGVTGGAIGSADGGASQS